MTEASFFLHPLLVDPRIRPAFVERVPGVVTSTDKEETLTRLKPHHRKAAHDLGFETTYLAEQVHGNELAIITSDSPHLTSGVDGLLTNQPGILLGIHVADCGVIYLLDTASGAIALLHSGKKGTELNILGKAVSAMTKTFETKPDNLVVVLGPCIRPPHYEIDFAATIRDQALAAGVPETQYHDCQLCTASDLSRYYSYRLEKGNTGRHLALLGRLPS
ncbi:MAG: polyphenol oxidase family protein [Akkermansiaceae bacterium]